MRFLIMSDTHGLVQPVSDIVRDHPVDYILHAGDSEMDTGRSPFRQMIMVRGNMDRDLTLQAMRLLRTQGLILLLVHGHEHGVKQDLLRLKLLAQEHGVRIVVYGHTHRPGYLLEEGVLYINPGSLARPRGYPDPTYVLMEVNLMRNETGEAGKDETRKDQSKRKDQARIVETGKQDSSGWRVSIDYYDLNGRKKPDLSGSVTLWH
ncbi:MAG: metallophosphoesterase [Candidatus Carbobacillus sp.]|uniref:Phosphoesterase n=1 Tax=Candidatus Carbonibacillus altaicus TaxID=2163959 RepID=A0A2R6Y5C4_9BACL|nr:metallophosphoesterase [Candidatus Carbobacillus sp.]PTQ57871.1 MAG: phosphoesterase [Candidatus Carbobacillus altaicus]